MEVTPPWAASSLAVLLAVLRRRGARNKYNLPPGRRPRPVIGNLNLIGPLPHRSIRELSAQYGPLMSLRFGSFPVVVGSSVDAAEFFLKTHDLAFLDRPRLACGKRLGRMFDRFVEHEDRRRREGQAFVPNDMVDQLLQLAGDPSLDVPIDRDGVKASILELITGGTDISSVTVESAMSELLRKPQALTKVTEELDRVVGRDRLVAEVDIPSLPYLDAVVKETMRLHPVYRVSREDTTLAGYDIPRVTRVLVNVWAIGRDPAEWGDAAEEFRPERFIVSDVDVKGQDLRLLPFGMVQLVLANLVHGFAWRLPHGVAPEKLSMEEKFGISVSRMDQLKAIPEPKLPDHLY
ncbi:cytochrome P450 71A1-like [Panicum miliaceum]|uniref:Cytochrome P450 71A1-like n=1 Tax=Panicum miliaceum TaxID=4540 RepID=A0A3L6RKK5_PANMI|nr:cytochrome P450 71A1-like [Panicum miliaceum]